MEAAKHRLKVVFDELGLLTPSSAGNATRLLIASHDFKFLGELVPHLETSPRFDVKFDGWETLHAHDVQQSLELTDWAKTIFCEWAGPSVPWYQSHKRPGTRLVVRLHAFELNGQWLDTVNFDEVDTLVVVSEHYRSTVIERFAINPDKVVVIPNSVNSTDLNRPKTPDAQFHLGLAGIVKFGKRPDRALDIIEMLAAHDERYCLHIRGRAPWDYSYEWENPEQKQLYLELYARIAESEVLRNRVIFEPFAPDMGTWLRQIGIVLSPSANESFHLAPAEGMASGAIPVIYQRPGAEDVFGKDYLVESTHEAVEPILSYRDRVIFERESARTKKYSAR